MKKCVILKILISEKIVILGLKMVTFQKNVISTEFDHF